MLHEKIQGAYLFSNDKAKLQTDVIHTYLSQKSYWAKNIPLTVVEDSIKGSECFAAYKQAQQIGFARVITDHASFGYLADVFILEEFQGQGLSKDLMKFIMDFPAFKKLRRFMLATKDAHGLYSKFGFTSLSDPSRFMEIKPFESYPG